MEAMSLSRPTILVVDDDPGLREALHLILDPAYTVIDAEDGTQALATLRAREVDLVLLDLVMPRHDGFEVLEQRIGGRGAPPVIVLSGLNNAWTAATAMRLGAVDYVPKPFDEDALLALIRDTLAGTGERGSGVAQRPGILLVGVQLGIYASHAVLLRGQCEVERCENVVDVFTRPTARPPAVVIVDLVCASHRPVDAIRKLLGHWPTAWIVVMEGPHQLDRSTSSSCTVLPASATVTDLLDEIRAPVGQTVPDLKNFNPRVTDVLNYLGTHYADASARRISRILGTSSYYLSNVFSAETGISLKGYISQMRVEAAKWLLAKTGEKLETIALRVGLHDASHLSRLFLRHTGDRPGAYRRHQAGTAR